MPSVGLIAAAWYFATVGRSCWSGLLFAAAVLFRVDAVVAGPAIVLSLQGAKPIRNAAILTATSAVIGLALAVLFRASVATVLETLRLHYAYYTLPGKTLANYLSVFNPAILVLCLLGATAMLLSRKWRLAAIVMCGVLPVCLVYGKCVSSPKYLLQAALFSTPAIAFGIDYAVRARAFVRCTVAVGAIALFACTYLSAPRTLPTDDGPRLSTGFARAPQMWRAHKFTLASCQRRFDAAVNCWMAENTRATIICEVNCPDDCCTRELFDRALTRAGYQ